MKYSLLLILIWANTAIAQLHPCEKVYSNMSASHLHNACIEKEIEQNILARNAPYFWSYGPYEPEKKEVKNTKLAEKEARYELVEKEYEGILAGYMPVEALDRVRVELRLIYDSPPRSEKLEKKIRQTFHDLNRIFPPATAESAPTLAKRQGKL